MKPAGNKMALTAEEQSKQNAIKAGNLDVDAIATIDGKSLIDIDMEGFEDKPWRKPGADLTDFFNYGFNELTWRQYCNKQRMLRDEQSGRKPVSYFCICTNVLSTGC